MVPRPPSPSGENEGLQAGVESVHLKSSDSPPVVVSVHQSRKYHVVRTADHLVHIGGCSELLVKSRVHDDPVSLQNSAVGDHRGRIGIISGATNNVSSPD